jgi:predicted metal-binding membrane protein
VVTTTPVATAGQPRLAYRALERRATATTIGVLLLLAAAAWWWTADRAYDMSHMTGSMSGMSGMSGMTDMPGMDMSGMASTPTTGAMVDGLSSVGVAMAPFDMSAWVFMGMWITMMIAMMFPTIAPIVLLHRMVMRRGGAGIAPTAAFAGGYLVVWAAAGLIPLGVLWSFRHVAHQTSWVAPVSGVVLILAGAYQFTRWKAVCLNACVSPLTFLSTHSFGTGLRGALRTGASHGLYCLGCCWALMTVLFVVGLMNLAWMAGIAVIFLVEKHWVRGQALTYGVGAAVVGFGIAVLAHPALLTTVA